MYLATVIDRLAARGGLGDGRARAGRPSLRGPEDGAQLAPAGCEADLHSERGSQYTSARFRELLAATT
jgi:hypothetical protein